jgi:hypothetical protein
MVYIIFINIHSISNISSRGHHSRDRMVVGLQLPVQSVPITTKIVSLTHPDTCHCAFDTTLCENVCQ